MFRNTKRFGALRITVAFAIALITLGTAAISSRAWLIRSFAAVAGSTAQQTPTAAGIRIRSPLEVELISVHPHGFQPREITRAKGRFLLELDDHSGLKTLALRITSVSGPSLRDVAMKHEEPSWSEEMDLAPGRYVVSEAAHPGWTCYINITP